MSTLDDRDRPRPGAAEARFLRETGSAGRIAGLVEPVAEELGFRLVRVKVSGRDGGTVQIMAERPDGHLSIDECARLSRKLSPLFDDLDPLPGGYRLEISSPGIDRPLVRPSDFETYAGLEAKIETTQLIGGRKRFRGVLEGLSGNEARLRMVLKGDAEPESVGLPLGLIGEARLVASEAVIRSDLARKQS